LVFDFRESCEQTKVDRNAPNVGCGHPQRNSSSCEGVLSRKNGKDKDFHIAIVEHGISREEEYFPIPSNAKKIGALMNSPKAPQDVI
jgi:hypothetical protein